MSAPFTRIRILAVAAIVVLGATLSGCTGGGGDAGADRSQQQSEELRDRLNTTQIDR